MVGNVDELTVSCTGRREMIKGTFGNDEVCFSGKNGVQYEKRTFIRLTLDGLDVWLAADFGLPVDLEELTSEIVETLLAASGR